MYIGELAGCREVPDPICPRFITFDSLAPKRTPMRVFDITMSGPIRISPAGLAEGLGDGMGIFILEWSGVDCGFGEGDGICIPGIVVSVFGDAPGDGDGMGISMVCCWEVCGLGEATGDCIPGMFISMGGVGRAVGAEVLGALSVFGIFMPGMFIPGMLRI